MNPDYIRSSRMSQSGGNYLTNLWRNPPPKLYNLCNRMRTPKVIATGALASIISIAIILLLWSSVFPSRLMTGRPVWARSFSIRGLPLSYLGVKRRRPCTLSDPCRFKLVADLDKKSKIVTGKKTLFTSCLMSGWIWEEKDKDKVTVEWLKNEITLTSKFNEDDRGMELSELLMYNGTLYSFDDRTGIVYEISNTKSLPKFILMEGNGSNAKGMKIEWATIKDNKMWIGSFGKEYTTEDGKQILHGNPFWIVTIDSSGNVEHINWEQVYTKIRKALNVSFPGYAIHEAVNWSRYLQKWIFLPRRVSALPYDESADETRGSNKLVLCNEDFSDIEVRTVNGIFDPRRGFSSFKFLPGSHDNVIVAVKSEENEELGTQKSYVTAFTIKGEVLLEDTEVPTAKKFEGIEFDDF